MDSDIEIIDKDSGMSSIGGSKDDTPERKGQVIITDFSQKPVLRKCHSPC